MTPVIEAMMVAEQKKDLTTGSEDLYTFSQMFIAIGTIFYCWAGAELVTNFNTKTFYLLPMMTGIFMFITALVYAENCKKNQVAKNSFRLTPRNEPDSN